MFYSICSEIDRWTVRSNDWGSHIFHALLILRILTRPAATLELPICKSDNLEASSISVYVSLDTILYSLFTLEVINE